MLSDSFRKFSLEFLSMTFSSFGFSFPCIRWEKAQIAHRLLTWHMGSWNVLDFLDMLYITVSLLVFDHTVRPQWYVLVSEHIVSGVNRCYVFLFCAFYVFLPFCLSDSDWRNELIRETSFRSDSSCQPLFSWWFLASKNARNSDQDSCDGCDDIFVLRWWPTLSPYTWFDRTPWWPLVTSLRNFDSRQSRAMHNVVITYMLTELHRLSSRTLSLHLFGLCPVLCVLCCLHSCFFSSGLMFHFTVSGFDMPWMLHRLVPLGILGGPPAHEKWVGEHD